MADGDADLAASPSSPVAEQPPQKESAQPAEAEDSGPAGAAAAGGAAGGGGDEDEDEEETCGFCKFMKAGGCKTAFNVSPPACSWGDPAAGGAS